MGSIAKLLLQPGFSRPNFVYCKRCSLVINTQRAKKRDGKKRGRRRGGRLSRSTLTRDGRTIRQVQGSRWNYSVHCYRANLLSLSFFARHSVRELQRPKRGGVSLIKTTATRISGFSRSTIVRAVNRDPCNLQG